VTHAFLAVPAWICGVAAVLGIAYTLVTAGLVGRFFGGSVSSSPARRESPLADRGGALAEPPFPAVTLVKPLHGAEWSLARNLASFLEQDYPGPVQHLFGVAESEDPALAVVEGLRRRYPAAVITVVADARQHGPNRKVSNLLNMLPQAQHDVLVFADSDVGVAPDYLRRVIGELHQPGVGLVTCLYRGEPDPGFWPRLSAMATNYQFMPGVITGLAFGRARPCFGQTIALRRDTLERAGGWGRLVDHLAEDHAMGEAVRALGDRVVIPHFAIAHACPENSLGKLVTHELRWGRTIRAVDPQGHLGFAVSQPLAFALLAAALSGGAVWSWGAVGAALIARLMLKVSVDRSLGRPVRDVGWLPLSDLLGFALFVATFRSQRVIWRGHPFTVDRRGRLTRAAHE
jgi:ceramide glucosyltransferase